MNGISGPAATTSLDTLLKSKNRTKKRLSLTDNDIKVLGQYEKRKEAAVPTTQFTTKLFKTHNSTWTPMVHKPSNRQVCITGIVVNVMILMLFVFYRYRCKSPYCLWEKSVDQFRRPGPIWAFAISWLILNLLWCGYCPSKFLAFNTS
jgi:hypothetical protein